ncbi:AraC family transcriptional regulator [Reyranella sp. CPCC 100927]|nr:AraC family transcriptional regulator [Reyranella sp. CPCC 100927]
MMAQPNHIDHRCSAHGDYAEAAPDAALRRHIALVWIHRLPCEPEPSVLVVPDGCIDLLWCDSTLSVAGPDRVARRQVLAPGSVVVGLRFQPGAARHWLRLPATDIVDQRIALEDIWGADARRLADEAGIGQDPEDIARRLQRGLRRRAEDVTADDRDMRMLFAQLSQSHDSMPCPVSAAAARLDVSPRTLRRRSHDAFGYGPKTLERILRFQRFLATARDADGLADCAAAIGYADQAHLSREVKRLSGLPPTTILDHIA